MTLDINTLKFDTDLPDLPRRLPVIRCEAPDLEARAPGMDALADKLNLGDLADIDTEYGRARASDRGAIEIFTASGAIWSENVTIDQEAQDEFREWPDLEETKDRNGEPALGFGRDATGKALELAQEMAESGQFDMKHATKPEVRLMQIAEADEEGKTLRQGAGEATVVFGYELDGLPVIGGGAKTLIDINPRGGEMVPTGAVNVWRTPGNSDQVFVGGTEAALEVGLLKDPDLLIAAEKGGQITIQNMRVGLMAMPAALQQSVLFPALEYEARVDFDDDELHHYFTGRVVPIVRDKAFARLNLASSHFSLGM